MEVPSLAKLTVTYNGCATQEGFSEYLTNKLPATMSKFTVTIAGQLSMDGTEFEVEFENKDVARQARPIIKKTDGLRVSLTNSSIQSEIDDFKLSLQRKCGSLY